MFDFAMHLIPGVLAAVAIYVLYVAATKGAPAAWTMVKGWWTSTKNDVASLKTRVSALEAQLGMHAVTPVNIAHPPATIPPAA